MRNVRPKTIVCNAQPPGKTPLAPDRRIYRNRAIARRRDDGGGLI